MGTVLRARFMAFERQWPSVAPQLLTADGGTLGQVQIADTRGFKVGMKAVIAAVGSPNLTVQIKRVLSETLILVGPVGSPYSRAEWTNISAYTIAASAYIFAESQEKTKVPANDREEATYDQEPTVAWRSVLVDQLGRYYESANPMPVVFEGSISIGAVEVKGTNGNFLEPNNDGSLNVNVVTTPASNIATKSVFNEISAVASGSQTQIVFYTVPLSKTAVLQRIVVSGENIARFDVYLNAQPFDAQRTYFGGSLNASFDFTTGNSNGIGLASGDTISVKVIHNRPSTASFNGRIQVLEIT
jgi:hypothetical protein